ncbi:hypothetical protein YASMINEVIRUS_638 [Yasminevirus sp. GU-2018]|uniref:Uncharacterized protein n=1 Tax=Yasminevirus sp. GU-2018 TaxID=2420051 RepID=A0A5K0U8Q6_9VIRU|nr:hypothetical protein YASMINEVIRUS_638 [Yasminevirus sp. GU-2018]
MMIEDFFVFVLYTLLANVVIVSSIYCLNAVGSRVVAGYRRVSRACSSVVSFCERTSTLVDRVSDMCENKSSNFENVADDLKSSLHAEGDKLTKAVYVNAFVSFISTLFNISSAQRRNHAEVPQTRVYAFPQTIRPCVQHQRCFGCPANNVIREGRPLVFGPVSGQNLRRDIRPVFGAEVKTPVEPQNHTSPTVVQKEPVASLAQTALPTFVPTPRPSPFANFTKYFNMENLRTYGFPLLSKAVEIYVNRTLAEQMQNSQNATPAPTNEPGAESVLNLAQEHALAQARKQVMEMLMRQKRANESEVDQNNKPIEPVTRQDVQQTSQNVPSTENVVNAGPNNVEIEEDHESEVGTEENPKVISSERNFPENMLP